MTTTEPIEPVTPVSPVPPPLRSRRQRVLDWFLPPEVRRDPEELRRARLVVVSSLVLVVVDVLVLLMVDWSPGTRVGPLVLPRPTVSALLLATLVHFSVAFTVKRTAQADRAAFFLTASLVIFFTFMAATHGGTHAPLTWWIAAVPILAAFLSGARYTLVTALLVLAVLFGFYAIEVTHLAPVPLAHMDSQDVLRAQVLLLGFVSFFGWYFERTRTDASRHLVGAYHELERINTALRMSQANVRQIAEHVGQGLWMHDVRTDRVVYANAAFEEVTGVSREAIAADPAAWRAHVHPDDAALAPGHADGRDHVYRLRLGGEERWVRHAVYAVGDATTPTHRAIHLVADITLQRTSEALRERYLETVFEVAENERRHLARELHDNTGGSLTALLVGLRALANTLEREDQRTLAGQLAEQTRTVVGDIQRLSRGLHPSVLDELGLVAAVGRLADDARDAHRLAADVRVQGREHEPLLSPTERLAIYRIVQEALANVGRHARATQVDIDLTITPDVVRVRVEDDGAGFDPEAPQRTHELSSGLGLMSMKERASLLGGSVVIESAPGAGTTVLGEIPVDRRGERVQARQAG